MEDIQVYNTKNHSIYSLKDSTYRYIIIARTMKEAIDEYFNNENSLIRSYDILKIKMVGNIELNRKQEIFNESIGSKEITTINDIALEYLQQEVNIKLPKIIITTNYKGVDL